MKPTRLDSCQYLLVAQINYTLTNYADHDEKIVMTRFIVIFGEVK